MMLLTASVSAQTAATPVVVGRMSQREVEAIVSSWAGANGAAPPSVRSADAFKHVRKGATVKVFFGTWCDDSKDVVPEFVSLVTLLGAQAPFKVEYVGVDRDKREPSRDLRSNGVSYLPTFIVMRHGHETGRIVEHAPNDLRDDLLHLLNGSATGLLSSNEDAIIEYLNGRSTAAGRP